MEYRANRKWAFFVLLTFFSLWFGGYVQKELHFIQGETAADFRDFKVYYTAGLVARKSEDKRLYSYTEIEDPNDPSGKIVVNPQYQAQDENTPYGRFAKEVGTELQYLYPPFFALSMAPLTYLPYEKAKIFWHVFIIFLLACAAVFLTIKLLYTDYLAIAIIGVVVIAAMQFMHPMQELQHGGNISTILLFLCAAGLYFHKKYPGFGAMFFALAVIIKLTPIVVVPLMLVRRQWKWLIAFCCWSILLFGISVWQLGWQNQVEFYSRVMPAMSNGLPQLENRSISTGFYAAATGKFMTYEDAREDKYFSSPRSTALLGKVIAILSFGGLLLFLWRRNKTDSQMYAEVLLLLLWSVVFSPVSLRHNYLLALAPVVFAWIHPKTRKASTFQLIVLSASTFMIFSVLPNYVPVVTRSFPVLFAVFLTMPVGVMLCMWYLITLLRSQTETLGESDWSVDRSFRLLSDLFRHCLGPKQLDR